MTSKEFNAALHSARLYGTLVASTSSRWVALLSELPLDFVFIDTEHMPIDRGTLGWMCQAYGAAGLPPVVRIASPDPVAAGQAVDAGAAAVVAPYVETVEQVRALVGAVKLRPLKGRLLENALTESKPVAADMKAYMERYSEGRSVILNIESIPAVESLDDLLAVPGVDAVLIGPHDLSCSMGRPEAYDDDAFEETLRLIFRKARNAGIGAGIHSWMPTDREVSWFDAGLNWIIHSSDLAATRDMVLREIAPLRKRLGDELSGNGGDAATV